jgi:LAS superfamily LD-carboxypeptidase LdcB
MPFKSFFEKFQTPPKVQKNWLMPFRNSGVKVNLKSVKFDRFGSGGVYQQKENDIQGFTRRSSTLPNLQKVDSFLETPVSIASTMKDDKLFDKIHNSRKSTINFGLIGLILLTLIVTSIGLFLFSSNKMKAKSNIVIECNKYLQEQKAKGFGTETLCEPKLNGLDYLFPDSKANTQFDTIKKSVTKQSEDLQNQLVQLDKDIRINKQFLASIDPNFEKDIPGSEKPIPNTVVDKQNFLNSLKLLLAQKDKLIQETLVEFTQLIKISTDLDTQKEQVLIKNFDNSSKSEKYLQFPALQESLKILKQKITDSSGDSFKKAVQNPEFFTLKALSGEEFKNLVDGSKFENTTTPNNDLISITGDDAADRHIIAIAESRGYKKRPIALEDGLNGSGNDRLQPVAREAYEKMVTAASDDGIRMGLVSGYRSISDQRGLFNSRFKTESANLTGKTFTSNEIVIRKADEAINNVLNTSSIPGYSRHHTGYTIDITDLNANKDFTLFANTEGYKWISANNYFNAKRFGFVPSYPPQASNQGPEPESWEYVYVGLGALK